MQKRQERKQNSCDNTAFSLKANTLFLSVNQLVNAEEQAVFWRSPRIHCSGKCKKTR